VWNNEPFWILVRRLRIAGEPGWKPNTVLRGLEHLWLEVQRP